MKMNRIYINSSNYSQSELFNFSFNQAVFILEEHLLRDGIFDGPAEASIITCYVILMIFGVFSNVLVSGVIIWNAKIRTHRNLYVVNLNASDIALCLFCMPFTLLELIRRSWPLGALMCKLVPFIQGSTVFVSAATVSAIAIDRHNTIVTFHHHQKQKKTTQTLVANTCIIWIFALLLSLPMCISQRVITVGLPGILFYEKCIEQWPSPSSKGVYTLLILITQFLIPATVLVVTHFRIKTHLRYSILQQKLPIHQRNSDRLQRELQRNHRATMVLMNISVVFAISWLPWNLLNLVADFYPESMSPQNLYLAFAICHIMAMTSATTNPILYGWLNSNVKHELLKIGNRFGRVFGMSIRSTNSDIQLTNFDNFTGPLSNGDQPDHPRRSSVNSNL